MSDGRRLRRPILEAIRNRPDPPTEEEIKESTTIAAGPLTEVRDPRFSNERFIEVFLMKLNRWQLDSQIASARLVLEEIVRTGTLSDRRLQGFRDALAVNPAQMGPVRMPDGNVKVGPKITLRWPQDIWGEMVGFLSLVDPRKIKLCDYCADFFVANTLREQRFCSDGCRSADYYENRKSR